MKLDVAGRPAWHADALCQEHPEVKFFSERGEDSRPAKAICRRCLVQEECLAYALVNGENFGVWGGTSGRERKLYKRKSRAPAPQES